MQSPLDFRVAGCTTSNRTAFANWNGRLPVHASAITVISKEEKAAFARVAPNAEVKVVPNGVDLDFFRSCAEYVRRRTEHVCFVGVLNYQPNVDGLCWFVERVWPTVRNTVPSAQFLIVGKSPSAAVRRLADKPGVELHADVPDVRPFLAQCGRRHSTENCARRAE